MPVLLSGEANISRPHSLKISSDEANKTQPETQKTVDRTLYELIQSDTIRPNRFYSYELHIHIYGKRKRASLYLRLSRRSGYQTMTWAVKLIYMNMAQICERNP